MSKRGKHKELTDSVCTSLAGQVEIEQVNRCTFQLWRGQILSRVCGSGEDGARVMPSPEFAVSDYTFHVFVRVCNDDFIF